MAHGPEPWLASSVWEAAARLRVDGTTAEVSTALDRAGVASILLKGPSFARWL